MHLSFASCCVCLPNFSKMFLPFLSGAAINRLKSGSSYQIMGPDLQYCHAKYFGGQHRCFLVIYIIILCFCAKGEDRKHILATLNSHCLSLFIVIVYQNKWAKSVFFWLRLIQVSHLAFLSSFLILLLLY